jgi:choline kinase
MTQKKQYIISPKKDRYEKKSELISVVLLSENHGYRMKSYGPISLVKIGEKTLIEHQLNAISSAFINFEIVLCAGFEASKIYSFIRKQWGPSIRIRIVENQVYHHSNCCESIRLCINNIMTDKVIICGGGVLLTPTYLKNLDLSRSSLLFQRKDPKKRERKQF